MGNCAWQASRHGAEADPWSDDDDGEPAWAERRERKRAGVEVTVRISQRRLRTLMAEAAAGGAGGGMTTVEEVLAEIVSAGGEVVVDGRHRRRWEPALRSIPEALESRRLTTVVHDGDETMQI
ncbi:hypothetical protein C2845_PM05G33310 [Panicum miliaceum]|uniref:Uncharacterized protein n=1 Tax=Panicum miliaceum TaxID=4540 RepID=A0A3L6SU60_PANMI|nr:hypothetical protein C2845_PM05G33310 [Panicum miliaceum]